MGNIRETYIRIAVMAEYSFLKLVYDSEERGSTRTSAEAAQQTVQATATQRFCSFVTRTAEV
jgi:hypothetical protein